MRVLVTGGAGFIGSALIRHLIANTEHTVINVDKLTYAGNLESLKEVESHERYSFHQLDILNSEKIKQLFFEFQPDVVMHLAAESHVDRSIDGPTAFIQTNIIGTYTLLEVARHYWKIANKKFIFHHISTDEVYGDLGRNGLFSETSPYAPSSPYSASKASSDHLVRAWNRTYKLPIVITNCSNNYGSHQFPEKLIPLIILNALAGKKLPVYGDGTQIRDWLFVDDHVRALMEVVTKGKAGDTYNIGGHNEKKNIDVINEICTILDQLHPPRNAGVKSYKELITYVEDRPGHDVRYAIDASKIKTNLGWSPIETFDSGIRKTVQWYLDNRSWCENVLDGSYQEPRQAIDKLDRRNFR